MRSTLPATPRACAAPTVVFKVRAATETKTSTRRLTKQLADPRALQLPATTGTRATKPMPTREITASVVTMTLMAASMSTGAIAKVAVTSAGIASRIAVDRAKVVRVIITKPVQRVATPVLVRLAAQRVLVVIAGVAVVASVAVKRVQLAVKPVLLVVSRAVAVRVPEFV